MSCVHIRQIDFYTATVIPKFPYFKRGRAEINATKKSYIKQQKAMKKKKKFSSCVSLGGRPGLSVLTSFLVSVDIKNYWTVLRHWSQLVPNVSTDIAQIEKVLGFLCIMYVIGQCLVSEMHE